jgi:hypothetical protein
MRRLRGAAVAVGVGLVAAGFAAAAGCGDDTATSPPADSGPDGETDGTVIDSPTVDSPAQKDSTTDSPALDSPGMDSPGPGMDGPAPEGSSDASDGGVTDASDGSSDAPFDAFDGNYPGITFATQQATALCTTWLNCCASGVNYNLQGCIDDNVIFGWEGTLPLETSVYTRGNITVNETKASQCITALQAFPCAPQTAAQWSTITQACELVIEGTIPIGQSGCISSFECVPGAYCDPLANGGTCTALQTQGQPCDTIINSTENPLPDQMCSYLGSSQGGLFCDLIDFGADAATCQPLLATGANCINPTTGYYDDQACQTSAALCGDNSECGGTASYPYAAFCSFWTSDAGGGG